MRFLADAEIGPDGSAQVFIRPLEGCYSRAPSLDEALGKAAGKIRAYLDWLADDGERVPREWRDGTLVPCETIHGDWPVNLGDGVALFNCDRGPLTDEEIARDLRWLAFSWRDFLDVRRGIPRGAWDFKPAGALRSPRRIVMHTALVMVWYVMKLRVPGEDPPFRWPQGMSMWRDAREVERGDLSARRLTSLREACVYRLAHLRPAEKAGRVTMHRPGGWTGRTEPEGWTARKVFRRFLWHEQLHMHTIRKLLDAYRATR
jgi:predicted RNase H-like HicB family nuclease